MLTPDDADVTPARPASICLTAIGDDLERAASAGAAGSRSAASRFLAGTTPTCEAITDGVAYRCTIEGDFKPEVQDLKGTVEPTVDATKHVNGGCRSLRSDGREWRRYVGQAAVDQKIIGPDFLGDYAPEPGVG